MAEAIRDLGGGVFKNEVPPEDRMAGIDDLQKPPLGPTLFMAGSVPVSAKEEVVKEEKPSA